MPPCVPSDIKKERTLLRSLVVHNNKRSEGDFVGNSSSKERSGKKRLRTSDREVDPRKKTLHSSKTGYFVFFSFFLFCSAF